MRLGQQEAMTCCDSSQTNNICHGVTTSMQEIFAPCKTKAGNPRRDVQNRFDGNAA